MKAIIIDDKDVKALINKLKLEREELRDAMAPVDEIYRRYNYVLVNWFQDQGWDSKQ